MSHSLGLPSGTVLVVPYDATWPELFAAEVERLMDALARRRVSLSFEHTGSTSVIGLAAKPVLDLLAGLPTDGHRVETIGALKAAGYVYRGEQGIPGRDFFRRGNPRQYHLHLTRVGSKFWHDHLAFRDYLRSHPDARGHYDMLKRDLAARFSTDREAYIDGKTKFVEAVLAQARHSG